MWYWPSIPSVSSSKKLFENRFVTNPLNILQQYWGHNAFRPAQEEIIQAVLEGKDTLAILPTGGGKSVCFQVPAMALDGCCLVISPLIALMEDQVQRLQGMDIPAAAIISGMSWQETEKVLDACVNDELKFLYVSPERLETRAFRDRLRHLPISMLAVDESHCISQWGYDFRPAYLHIARIKETLPHIPVMALTASATPEVQADIIRQLKMRNPARFTTSFTRKNLSYKVLMCQNKIGELIKILETEKGTGIVYCRSRRKTRELSELLQQHGISSNCYHAGLDQDTRKERQESWITGKTMVMVCTNAFGMGIDKPDVRVVVHADVPDCLENYYQEAGRAGRDGLPAKAILLYNERELAELRLQPDIRYPSMSIIRKVYHALANFLQVPTGGGVGVSYDFDLEEFISRFKINLNEVVYSLQALKQENIISHQEMVFMPSTVQFVSDKHYLEELENNFPQYEPLIKALLRTYAGIFDYPVRISEKQLAWKLYKDINAVKTELLFLHRAGAIRYIPQKQDPQINFLQGRIQTDELNVNHTQYLARKAAYEARIEKMIGYINGAACRSAYIGAYFGDKGINDCGICDLCSQKRQRLQAKTDMDTLMRQLEAALANKLSMEELSKALDMDNAELKDMLQFLKDEGRINMDNKGRIGLK
jgi:ATP-dependent DNA helicase RecQ